MALTVLTLPAHEIPATDPAALVEAATRYWASALTADGESGAAAWLAANPPKHVTRYTADKLPPGILDGVSASDPVAAAAAVPTPAGPEPFLSIPHPRPNGDIYHSRPVGTSTPTAASRHDVDMLRAARSADISVLLYGPPGTGKTAMAEAAFGDLLTVSGTGDTEVQDFIGSWTQAPDGTFVWVDGPLLEAMEKGLPLLVDEIALIDPRVMSLVYSAMDGRREVVVTANPSRGTVTASDGFYVVAAMNPNAPGARMSEAMLSRFGVHIEVRTDFDVALQMGVSQRIVRAARNLATKVDNGETGWAPQMREVLTFHKLTKVFDEAFALANLVSSAPEDDRPVVEGVLKSVFGDSSVTALALGDVRSAE